MRNTIVLLMILLNCSCVSTSEPPKEVVLYCNQMQYFYENPTIERLKLVAEYRDNCLDYVKSHFDEDAYKHSVAIDSVFFGLVKEKYGFDIIREHNTDNISWTSKMILDKPIQWSGDLDLYWACFSATGDIKWVDMIINQTSNINDKISRAARWSLKANYKQHNKLKIYIDSKPAIKSIIYP